MSKKTLIGRDIRVVGVGGGCQLVDVQTGRVIFDLLEGSTSIEMGDCEMIRVTSVFYAKRPDDGDT